MASFSMSDDLPLSLSHIQSSTDNPDLPLPSHKESKSPLQKDFPNPHKKSKDWLKILPLISAKIYDFEKLLPNEGRVYIHEYGN